LPAASGFEMTLEIRRVAARHAWELGGRPRTLHAPAWVAEFEEFVFGRAFADTVANNVGTVWLIRLDGEVIGAAASGPHGSIKAELLQAMVILPSRRGHGLGRQLLEAVVAVVHERSGEDYVVWLVHQHNEPMRSLSASFTLEDGAVNDDDYILFCHELVRDG
jgi:GNAT superfamily N-acetyltransferase